MSELGAIFYSGPSLLTGDPIVGVLTGLEHGSQNPKTGPMAQAWILRPDLPPMDAKRANVDDAICGDSAVPRLPRPNRMGDGGREWTETMLRRADRRAGHAARSGDASAD